MGIVATIFLIIKDTCLTMLIAAAAANAIEEGKTRWFLNLFVLLALLV